MMTPLELRADLYRRGICLAAGPDGIEWEAPPDTLTDEDCAAIKAHKPALLQLLARAVTVYAPALGCEVLCVETLDDIPDGYAGPVYTRAELQRMRGLNPAELQSVHELKQEWGGEREGRAENPDPPAWKPGDRVRGYDGESWKYGTVLAVLKDDGWTALNAIGMVMVQQDHTPHETVFRPDRLWPAENEEPFRPSQ